MGRAWPCPPDREGEHPHAAKMEAIVWRISAIQRRSQPSDLRSLLRSPYDWKGNLERELDDGEGANHVCNVGEICAQKIHVRSSIENDDDDMDAILITPQR